MEPNRQYHEDTQGPVRGRRGYQAQSYKDAKAYYGRGVMYQRLGQQELADRDFAVFRYNRKAKELKEE